LGIWGASAGVSNLLGPLLGGLLTLALGWRADWWALVPLTLLVAGGIVRVLPAIVHSDAAGRRHPVLNPVVLAATLVAGVTFAVMIGCFYLAEQYLQLVARYSALGAASVLTVVAVLVGAAAPLAGWLADRRSERLPAVVGFLAAAVGLLVLGIPGVSLRSAITLVPLISVGLGLGLLFVPTSRAALNSTQAAAHGRTAALLSVGRLLGAAVGAGLAGLALSGGADAATVHRALLVAGAACVVIGIPAAARLGTADNPTSALELAPGQ
jgi:predicted MFS family arabinose efflux permease